MATPQSNSSAYLFSFEDINGNQVRLSDFEDKVILVVNTASQCGYTPQYAKLQALHQAYKDKGLVVLGVPSADFGNQEFDDKAKIKAFTHDKYGVSFKIMSPAHVKGEKAHPFYIWAKNKYGQIGAPRWNFHKYLINKHGQLVAWFPSSESPDSTLITETIDKTLKEK